MVKWDRYPPLSIAMELSVKQAGAELCQAQDKLGLAKPALPSKNFRLSSIFQKWKSSTIYLQIEVVFDISYLFRCKNHTVAVAVVFQFPKKWGHLPLIKNVGHLPIWVRL